MHAASKSVGALDLAYPLGEGREAGRRYPATARRALGRFGAFRAATGSGTLGATPTLGTAPARTAYPDHAHQGESEVSAMA